MHPIFHSSMVKCLFFVFCKMLKNIIALTLCPILFYTNIQHDEHNLHLAYIDLSVCFCFKLLKHTINTLLYYTLIKLAFKTTFLIKATLH